MTAPEELKVGDTVQFTRGEYLSDKEFTVTHAGKNHLNLKSADGSHCNAIPRHWLRKLSVQEEDGPMDGGLILIEGDVSSEMGSYLELLDYAIRQTYEICVNSPEEYDDLTDEQKAKLDKVHEIWL